MSAYRFSLDVPVRNEWTNVELVRVAVQNCFEAVFHDIAGRDALAMVTGELLENAIKYGHWSGGQGSFRLRVWGDATTSAVAVTNPIAGGSDGPARVREILDFIAAQPSAADAYRTRLLALAGTGSTSGLGLVRIAYEGECELRAQLSGDELEITAQRRHSASATAAVQQH